MTEYPFTINVSLSKIDTEMQTDKALRDVIIERIMLSVQTILSSHLESVAVVKEDGDRVDASVLIKFVN